MADRDHPRRELHAVADDGSLLHVGEEEDRAAVVVDREVGYVRQDRSVALHPQPVQVYPGQFRTVVPGGSDQQLHIGGPEERLMFPWIVEAADCAARHHPALRSTRAPGVTLVFPWMFSRVHWQMCNLPICYTSPLLHA